MPTRVCAYQLADSFPFKHCCKKTGFRDDVSAEGIHHADVINLLVNRGCSGATLGFSRCKLQTNRYFPPTTLLTLCLS